MLTEERKVKEEWEGKREERKRMMGGWEAMREVVETQVHGGGHHEQLDELGPLPW